MEMITTTDELASVCNRLAKHRVITVDTEFLRETTYYPLLCVVQMASADEAVVIDALAEGIDLKPFFDLMANENVLKVFHAARQDIEIIFHRASIIPHPVFDTQVAAMVLGYGDLIAYDQLVERITGHRPDKTHRFTDWSNRPLSQDQITYAVADVTHLRDVFAALDADLKKRGRSEWVSEEMDILTSPKDLRRPARARMGAAQNPRPQAEGSRSADGSRGMARTGSAEPRRAALARAEGRRYRRYCNPRTDLA
jgi:ribonuclease D